MVWGITWSPTARFDLKGVFEFISEDKPNAARDFVLAVMESVDQLADLPRIGRVVPEFADEDLRELIHPPYRIVYRVDEAKSVIEIVRIWHAARGNPEI